MAFAKIFDLAAFRAFHIHGLVNAAYRVCTDCNWMGEANSSKCPQCGASTQPR